MGDDSRQKLIKLTLEQKRDILMSVPDRTIGSKSESAVVPNVVVPANVRDAPVWRARLRVLEAGAETPESKILVQDLTADETPA